MGRRDIVPIAAGYDSRQNIGNSRTPSSFDERKITRLKTQSGDPKVSARVPSLLRMTVYSGKNGKPMTESEIFVS